MTRKTGNAMACAGLLVLGAGVGCMWIGPTPAAYLAGLFIVAPLGIPLVLCGMIAPPAD